MRHRFKQLPIDAPSVEARWATAREQKRPDVREARRVWIARRRPFMRNPLPRTGFIDVEAGKGIDPGDRYPPPKVTENEHGQNHRSGPEGRAPDRSCALRPLEHPASSRPCGPAAGCALGHRRANEPGVVRSSWQNAVGSGLAAGRRDRSRQPVFTKEPRRGGGHEGSRGGVSLPSALQPKPQPHRNGIRQAQSPHPEGCSKNP